MVKIRLARTGAKKRPFYHIVVADQRRSRDGHYIERLGFFNPVAVGGERPLKIDVERVEYWQGQGAQLSERVLKLVKQFRKHGETEAPQRAAPPVSKAKAAPQPKAEEKAAETTENAAAADTAAADTAAADTAAADTAAEDTAAEDNAAADNAGKE